MRRRYMIEPITNEQQFRIHTAKVELEAGELGRIVADVRAGYASVELYEDDLDDLSTFGIDPPLRFYTPRRRLKVELDALFEQMTFHRPPGPEMRER